MKKLKELFRIIIAWLTDFVNGKEIEKLQANEKNAQQQALLPVQLQTITKQKYDPQSGIMLLEDHQSNSVVKQRINQINHDPATYNMMYSALCHEVVKGGILSYFQIIADDLYFDIGRLILNAVYNENRYLSSRDEDYIPMNATDISIINAQKYKFNSMGLLLYYDLGKLNGEQKQQFWSFWKKATATPFYLSLKYKYGFANLKISFKNVTLIISIV